MTDEEGLALFYAKVLDRCREPLNASMRPDCIHTIKNDILPEFAGNKLVALAFIPLYPFSQERFTHTVKADLDVAKTIARCCTFYGYVPYPTRTNVAFIDYVFREAPAFAYQLPRCSNLVRAFTSDLMELVMDRVRTGLYSEKMFKYLPVLKRRVYAHYKLVEYDQFVRLLVCKKLASVDTLNREVAEFLGLAVSRRWRGVLKLVAGQIY